MQGRCWTHNLSTGRQNSENFLSGTKKLQGDKDCPEGTYCDWSTIYSSLGMAIHAVENSDSSEVVFGAPGTYAWKGAIGVKKQVIKSIPYVFISFLFSFIRGDEFVLSDKLKVGIEPPSIYDYAGYSVDSGIKQRIINPFT